MYTNSMKNYLNLAVEAKLGDPVIGQTLFLASYLLM